MSDEKYTKPPLGNGFFERRKKRRFEVGWDCVIKGEAENGLSFRDEGRLVNLGSDGAFLYLTNYLKVGTKIEIWIKLPSERGKWMRHTARVVRVENVVSIFGVALKFSNAKPQFSTRIDQSSESQYR